MEKVLIYHQYFLVISQVLSKDLLSLLTFEADTYLLNLPLMLHNLKTGTLFAKDTITKLAVMPENPKVELFGAFVAIFNVFE